MNLDIDKTSDLPHDVIIYNIIIRLPIKTILKLKLISKLWYFTISSSHFGFTLFKFTTNYAPFIPTTCCLFIRSRNDYFIYSYDDNVTHCHLDDESNKCMFKLDRGGFDGLSTFVIGTCNGLLCIHCSISNVVIIWNPVTNQSVKFPCPFIDNCKNTTWGFGYVSCINDYKVVRISELTRHPNEIVVDVFSLRTRKWKQVYDYEINKYFIRGASNSSGLLINESLYWIMYRKNGDGDDQQDVLGFDLILERFSVIQGLVPGNSYLGWVRFLCSMGGCLCMARFTNRGDVSLSILKQCGQVDYIGLYRDLDLGSCCNAVGFTGNGKFFVQLGERELGLVDPCSSPKRYTSLVKFHGDGFIDIKSYVPSLVSPFGVAETRE